MLKIKPTILTAKANEIGADTEAFCKGYEMAYNDIKNQLTKLTDSLVEEELINGYAKICILAGIIDSDNLYDNDLYEYVEV